MFDTTVRPLHWAICLTLALATADLHAWSPPFCSDDSFEIDVNRVRLPTSPASGLFPQLSIDDFPRTPDSVRLRVIAQDRDEVVFESFHRRGASLGLYARVQATQHTDPRSGRRQITLTRLDDPCVAAADAAGVAPERMCARLSATELLPGAYTLDFQHRYANHQLQFTMVQDMRIPNEWSMVASGRAAEPERLQMTTTESGGVHQASWSIVDRTERATFEREIRADVAMREVERAGFNAFERGLLSALDLFDELTDEHADWTLYYEQEDVFEPPPSPGDEDDLYGCEPADGVCGAEYDTCIPTPGGWVGCIIEPGGVWGGGHGDDEDDGCLPLCGDHDDDDDGEDDPPILPDWQVGSPTTTPAFPRPYFHGMHVDYDADGNATNYGFSYDLTSVLQKAPTTPRFMPQSPGVPVEHVVGIFLTSDNGSTTICAVGRKVNSTATTIEVGDSNHYRSPDAQCANEASYLRCTLPKRGVYILHYDLDSPNLWDEGSDGEANNLGRFRGVHLED